MKKSLMLLCSPTTTTNIPSIYSRPIIIRTISSSERSDNKEHYPSQEETRIPPDPKPGSSPGPDLTTGPRDPPPSDPDAAPPSWDPTLSPPGKSTERTQPDRPPMPPPPTYQSSS